jgi:membrane fusion protein (multidrug efflux system)
MPASTGPEGPASRPRLPGPTVPPEDRPEAFGRGEHVDPDQQQKDEKDGDGKGQPGGEKQGGDQKKEEQKDPRPFWKRPVLMIVLGVVLLGGIIAGVLLALHGYHYEETDDAFIDGRIIRISPRVAGKVITLNVDDNRFVKADDVLIEIDPAPYQVKVDQAVANVAQAGAQLEQSKANQQVAVATADQADADVTVAVANAKNAEEDINRYNRLTPQARTQQQIDLATANQAATAATVTSAQKKAIAMHRQADAAAKMVDSSQAAVKSAIAQKEQADLDLSYCQVRAGHKGRVTRRTVEVGNYVSVGQEILDVVPTDTPDDLWVTANFKETQLTHIKPGQHVTITVDAFPDEKLDGVVDSIQNGTGAVFSLLPPENATGNYVKVVQRVPVKIIIEGHPTHLLSPGMSVEPEVDISARPDPTIGDEPTRPATTQHDVTEPAVTQP